MTVREMRKMDLINPSMVYRLYKDYMFLYQENEKEHHRAVSDDDIRDRIDYILRNNIKQRDEISTLCWVLGVEDVREKREIDP